MHKIQVFLYAFLLWGVVSFIPQDEVKPKEIKAIKQQLRKMESAANANQMQNVAAIYLDNGYLLSLGNEPITGREKINQYWLKTQEVINWKLESKLFASDIHQIYAHAHYQKLKNKPPDWKDLNLDLKNVVYELGVSKLTLKWQGKPHISVVTYILLWQKQTDGNYKILVDTYTSE